jgi:glutathione synthase/RimK-type ligase-like ATP-grasp enzyme
MIFKIILLFLNFIFSNIQIFIYSNIYFFFRFKSIMEENGKGLWILKPVANACGRGIKLINSKKKFKLQNKKNYLASEYIKKPHLINGK